MATKMKAEELEALDSDSIRSRITMQRADGAYLESHYQDFLSRYRHQWVIISEGKFIKAESDPDRLLDDLSKTKLKGVLVYYIADPEEVMLL